MRAREPRDSRRRPSRRSRREVPGGRRGRRSCGPRVGRAGGGEIAIDLLVARAPRCDVEVRALPLSRGARACGRRVAIEHRRTNRFRERLRIFRRNEHSLRGRDEIGNSADARRDDRRARRHCFEHHHRQPLGTRAENEEIEGCKIFCGVGDGAEPAKAAGGERFGARGFGRALRAVAQNHTADGRVAERGKRVDEHVDPLLATHATHPAGEQTLRGKPERASSVTAAEG
jgi:hypothetical protein